MKVKLLKDLGIHKAGTILDVDSTIVIQLEKDGNATVNLETKVEIVVEAIEEIVEEVIENTESKTNETVVEETTTSKVYTDSKGKTYTEEEFLKMDKRTNIYKEIQANLK